MHLAVNQAPKGNRRFDPYLRSIQDIDTEG